MEYEVTVEDGGQNMPVHYAQDALPPQLSVAPTMEGSQIDSVMRISSLALARPRNEPLALKKAIENANPSWLWRIKNRGEGLSVKCARSIIRYYRNVAVNTFVADTVIPGDNGRMIPSWRLTALAIDMENLVVETSTATVPKPARNNSEADLAYTQRCLQQQLSFLGRIERNAIMKIVPGEWQDQIKEAIYERERSKPLPARIEGLIKSFAAMGISERNMETVLGINPRKMSEGQYQDMLGRGMAVKNDETTKEEAFPELYRHDEASEADLPANTRALNEAIKSAGSTPAGALATARELFGDDIKRLENLTQGQADQLIGKLRDDAMRKMEE
jgi:hypothetical protein